MGLSWILIKRFWKQITLVLLISAICYTGYYKIKNIGYEEASIACAKKAKEYDDKLNTLIKAVETSSTLLISANEASQNELKKSVSNILISIKNKPLYTIVAGKCAPSADFINVYNEAVNKVNKK